MKNFNIHLVDDNGIVVLFGKATSQIFAVVTKSNVKTSIFANIRFEENFIWYFT